MGVYKDMIDIVKNNNCKKKQAVIQIIIYIIITIAAMSDILRIPGTSVTFFRISIPVAVFIILLFPKWAKRFIVVSGGFLLLNILYNLFFYKIYRTDLYFQFSEFLRYCILYISVFVVIFLVCIIKEISKEKFEIEFIHWIQIIGVVLIVVLLLFDLFPSFFGKLPIDNPNNYGCYIAAVCPFYLINVRKGRILFLVLTGACIVSLYINDCKISLFGMLFQIALLIFIMSAKTKYLFCIQRVVIPLVAIAGVAIFILFLNPSMHGYSLQGIISEPISRILTNNPYPTYTASVSFRTNTTIFALNMLWSLKGLGLGAGNLGIVLKEAFPNINPAYTQALNATTMSLHNSWLEFMLDMGLVGIILLIVPIIYSIKLYFGKNILSYTEKLALIFIMSFPIWSIGPSGVYTQYYLFTIIMFLVICRKDFNYTE